jgi:3-oxoadipate enol-lactonase
MTWHVDVAGSRLAYDVVGDGPAIAWLHAGIADRSMWEPQVLAFSDRYTCISPDIRGFGDTPVGNVPFSRRDDLAAVLDAVGVDSATLVGCSIGAGFALDFAIERPERVDKLVLVGVTPAGFDHEPDPELVEAWNRVDELIEAGELQEAGWLEARIWVDGLGRPEGTAPDWLRAKVVEWSLPINSVEDWGDSIQLDPLAMERLDEVRAPTLVVVGLEDAEVVIEGCRATEAGIESGRLVVLDGTAHLPNLEVPKVFNATLEEFLA